MNEIPSRTSRPLLGLGLVLFTLGIACLGALDLALGKPDPRHDRFDALRARAGDAIQEERWEAAEGLLRKARAERPDRADLVVWHAASLGQLGKVEEAFAALAEAGRLGYPGTFQLEREEAFAPLRGDPRFAAVLATSERNKAALKERAAAADAAVPPAEAPSFPTLAALEEAFEREEIQIGKEDYETSEPDRRSLRMRRIAALERYASEHPEARDRAETSIEALRAWRDRAGWGPPWRSDPAKDLATRAMAIAADPSATAEHRNEARFSALLARAFAGPEDDKPRASTPPSRQGCDGALEQAAAMASDPGSGPWGARAAALHAICLQVVRPDDLDAFRASQARWTAAALPRTSKSLSIRRLDGILETLTVAAALKTFGPPEFELTSSDGKTITLESLRGKVVLLNFWSPG